MMHDILNFIIQHLPHVGLLHVFPMLNVANGSTADANDVISTSGKAADVGKIPKINGSGELDNTFLAANNSKYDQSQTTQNSSTAVGEANATTKKNKLTQTFVPAVARVKGIEMYKAADTGSFTGTVTLALYATTAGVPSGGALATVTITNAQWLGIPTGLFQVPFAAEYTQIIGAVYAIQISTSTADTSNHPNFGHNTAGGYGSGACYYNNTTDGWVLIATIDLYFQIINGTVGAGGKGDTTGRLPTNLLPYSLVELNTANSTGGTAYTKVLEAGFFTANSGIKLKGYIDANWNQNTGPQSSVGIYLNGVLAATLNLTSAAPGGASTVNQYSGNWEAYIQNTAINAQQGVVWSLLANAGLKDNTTTGYPIVFVGQNEMTSAIDTSGVVVLTVVYGGSWTHYNVAVEKIG